MIASSGSNQNIDMIEYTLQRKKIKNINLYVKAPDGRVLVTAPYGVSQDKIDEFVRSREDWIQKHREQIRKRQETAVCDTPEKTRELTQDEKQLLLLKIYRLAKKWEPVMEVHCEKWSVRSMHTRWGSCSTKAHTIRLASALFFYDEELLEYVLVHELCHLLEPSHNARFHKLMSGFLPDYLERRKRLNAGG